MFWLTLRQYIRERRQSLLADYEKYPMEEVSPDSSSPITPRSISEMIRMYCFGNIYTEISRLLVVVVVVVEYR